MKNPFVADSPSYYARLRTYLSEFRNPYVEYVNRTADAVYAGKRPVRDGSRADLVKKAVLAHHAVAAAGLRIGWLPPPVFSSSTPPIEGLAGIAFAHENEAYRGFSQMDIPRPYEAAVDIVDQADAILAEKEKEATRRRKNPLYWIDRGLRLVVGIPAYVISIAFGFDLREVSDTTGSTLWWFSILADGASVFGLGLAQGWW